MNRTRAIALLSAVLVFATVAVDAWGTAPGKNGNLVFRRYFDKGHSWGALFTADPSGKGVRQLTHPERGVLDNVPDWSPDGRRVAFQRVDPNGCGARCETDEIYVVAERRKAADTRRVRPGGQRLLQERAERRGDLQERTRLVTRRQADRLHLRVLAPG